MYRGFAKRHADRAGLPFAFNLGVIHRLATHSEEVCTACVVQYTDWVEQGGPTDANSNAKEHNQRQMWLFPEMAEDTADLYRAMRRYDDFYLAHRRGEVFAANALEAPRHLKIPAIMPVGICALEYRHQGRRKVFTPISVMMPPLQCPVHVPREKDRCLHNDGENLNCTCWKNSSIAATLRALKVAQTQSPITNWSHKQLPKPNH